MAKAYTREFLVAAYMHRFIQCKAIAIEKLELLENNAYKLYDEVGRDRFRAYASLDADAVRQYKNSVDA